MNGQKSKHDSELGPNSRKQNTSLTDTQIDSLHHVHTASDQSADTNHATPFCKDTCHMIGWATGVVLALLVAIVVVHGVAPDMAALGVMMPVMLGSALAAMASLA